MKVKEVKRTANVAWSPSALQDIYLACGTVAQQLDATFRYTDAYHQYRIMSILIVVLMQS